MTFLQEILLTWTHDSLRNVLSYWRSLLLSDTQYRSATGNLWDVLKNQNLEIITEDQFDMMDGTSGAYDQPEANEIITLDNGEWAAIHNICKLYILFCPNKNAYRSSMFFKTMPKKLYTERIVLNFASIVVDSNQFSVTQCRILNIRIVRQLSLVVRANIFPDFHSS